MNFSHFRFAILLFVLALRGVTHAASPFTTGKLFDAQGLVPPPREENFATPQGRAEWMFAEPGVKISPARVGTLALAEGHMQFTLGKDSALAG